MKQLKEVEKCLLDVETNITNWQRCQNVNNNFSIVIPYDMKVQRKEAKEITSVISKGINATEKVLKGTFGTVKKTVTGINNIINIGTGQLYPLLLCYLSVYSVQCLMI